MKILSRDLPKRNIRERVKDNIRRFFTEMGQDKVGYLFLAIFGSLLLLICVQDWLFIRQNASDDSAGEFLYMHKVWETGNPFTPAYANNNELFFSRPWFLYVLFYFLTHSIILSSKFTLIFSVILLSICGIYFFRKIGYEWPTVFFALTIFLGLIPSQTVASAFRFFVAYSLFYCGTFVFLAIIIELEQSNKISKIQYVVILGMAVYFGLCGMRMSFKLFIL